MGQAKFGHAMVLPVGTIRAQADATLMADPVSLSNVPLFQASG
jgi:hypothetical protein